MYHSETAPGRLLGLLRSEFWREPVGRLKARGGEPERLHSLEGIADTESAPDLDNRFVGPSLPHLADDRPLQFCYTQF